MDPMMSFGPHIQDAAVLLLEQNIVTIIRVSYATVLGRITRHRHAACCHTW